MGEYDYIIECSKLRDINKKLREQIEKLTDLVKDLRGCDDCDYSEEFKDTLINELEKALTSINISILMKILKEQSCTSNLQIIVSGFKYEINKAENIDELNEKLRNDFHVKKKKKENEIEELRN